MSSGRPSFALLARCGSAIWPRTIDTMSAWPDGHDIFGIFGRADMAFALNLGVLHDLLQRLGIGRAELVGEEDSWE